MLARVNQNFVMNLDRIDLSILIHLQSDGRMTNSKLAELVNLSPSPCLMRVRNLENGGYITGYRAIVSRMMLGDRVVAIAQVTIVNHRRRQASQFEAAVCGLDEVVEFHMVNGRFDYIIKFVTRDLNIYRDLMEGLLNANLGMKEYRTYLVEKEVSLRHPYPVDGAR